MRNGRTIFALVVALPAAILSRAVAILVAGVLVCSPFATFAAGANWAMDAPAESTDMAMAPMSADGAEMPCHGTNQEKKHCPLMAICMAVCCQGLAPTQPAFSIPTTSAFRVFSAPFARLDGIDLPPPSRPPKA